MPHFRFPLSAFCFLLFFVFPLFFAFSSAAAGFRAHVCLLLRMDFFVYGRVFAQICVNLRDAF